MPRRTSPTVVDPRIALCDAGLLLGAETPLARFTKGTDRLAVDPARLEAMFAVAFRRAPSSRDLAAIEAAATHWQRGDKALANLRLVVADLPQLREAEDAVRLKAAELLFDAGLRVDRLAKAFNVDAPARDLEKYDENQPRVPAGSGKESGRWAKLWSRFSAWLAEEVPEYDDDFGTQVGTRSRARAILTNPLTLVGAGAAILLGGEVLAGAGAVGAVTVPEAGAAAAIVPVAEGAEVLAGATAIESTAVVLDDVGIAANAARGTASQARVLKAMGLTKNTRAVMTNEGRAIPDALTREASVEIKDAAYVSATKQVRIQTRAAEASGRESVLVTGERTKISKQASEAFNRVQRRSDLGPR